MKKNFLLKLLGVAFILTVQQAMAQEQKATWAGDVNVAPTAGRYYKNARVSVAYDGTIYVGRIYSTVSAAGPYRNWEVLKSTDTGHNFTPVLNNSLGASAQYRSFDMITAGANATDFKIFVARSGVDTGSLTNGINYTYVTAYDTGGAAVNTLVSEVDTFADGHYRGREGISISSDWRAPNDISAPYEIDVVMQKSHSQDSIIVYASKDAGATVARRGIYGTTGYIMNVSGSTGSAPLTITSFGRFGVVWNENASFGSRTGEVKAQIVYADDATDPGTNAGVQSLFSGFTNYSNATIVLSQQTNPVTGPGDIRAMVMYETNLLPGGTFSVGCNSTDSITSKTADFTVDAVVKLGVAAGGAYDPHGMYDPAADNFLITYYDSSIQGLVYAIKPLSATIAAVPTVFKANYRDAVTNLGYPAYPRVDINSVNDKAVFVWNDNSTTMFDAEYAVPVSVQSLPVNVTDVQVFPNPANDNVNVAFVAQQNDNAVCAVYDITGRQVMTMQAAINSGANRIHVNTNTLPAGNYTIAVRGESVNVNMRFTKQ